MTGRRTKKAENLFTTPVPIIWATLSVRCVREWGRGNTLTNYLDMTTYPPRGSQIRACTCTPFVPCRTRSQCSGCRSSSVCQRLKGKEKCWWNYSKNMKLSYKNKKSVDFAQTGNTTLSNIWLKKKNPFYYFIIKNSLLQKSIHLFRYRSFLV